MIKRALAAGLILPVLFAACAPRASVREPGDEIVAAPPTPDRDDLPRVRGEDEGKSIPAGATRRELTLLIAAPGVNRRKVDAAIAWADRFDATGEGREYWDRVTDSLDLMDRLFDREGDRDYRRFAIAEIFGAAAGSVRDAVPFHPERAPGLASWKRLTDLRDKGLRDRDPKLAEFFERYVPLDADPDWTAAKQRNLTAFTAALKEFPDKKETLNEIWKLESSIETSQLLVRDRLADSARRDSRLSPPEAERLVGKMKTVFAYRLYTSWGNLCSRNFRDLLGEEDAARLGVKVDPVKLGWPDY